MRSVPHRVVVLLGLDDDVFPRKTERDGDDLVAAEPMVGDGDGRSEDRQLLLDAVLAATARLVITYSGNDERTNAPLPPAVPVGELLDLVDATVRVESDDGTAARDRIVVHHPLQPFDPRNFASGRARHRRAMELRRQSASTVPRRCFAIESPTPSFLAGPLPPPTPEPVLELDSLIRFVQHPVKAFLRQRLGVSLADFVEELDDAISVELDGLGRWGVGDRVLSGPAFRRIVRGVRDRGASQGRAASRQAGRPSARRRHREPSTP